MARRPSDYHRANFMSSTSTEGKFRLLDPFTGWDVPSDQAVNLIGIDPADEIRLALAEPGALDENALNRFLLPANMAWLKGEIVLLTRRSRHGHHHYVRIFDPCDGRFDLLWDANRCSRYPHCPVAIAAHRNVLAVSDAALNCVRIWSRCGEQFCAEIRCDKPGPLALNAARCLFVATAGGISCFDANGAIIASLPLPKDTETVDRLALSNSGELWIVAGRCPARLWRWNACGSKWIAEDTARLSDGFSPQDTRLLIRKNGFCLGHPGVPTTDWLCFTYHGDPIARAHLTEFSPPAYQSSGSFLTAPLNSGIPRCRWHRVRVDADVPPQTSVEISVYTTESKDPDEIISDRDWQSSPACSTDFLVDQPAGQFLRLKLTLKGNGVSTPVVRGVRLDFPRSTSLEYLPPIYREDPDAADFTERFLSIFDASISEMDDVISSYPLLLDTESTPAAALPWVAGFMGLTLDPSWPPDLQRRILKAVPDLYRRRGTVAGLADAIQLVFNVRPTIKESTRPWATLGKKGTARLGHFRLFGKASSRFRIGSSRLGMAPIHSYGTAESDSVASGAFRFQVMVPVTPQTDGSNRKKVQALIENLKPAHTLADVRFGERNRTLGTGMALGIDTELKALPAPILGGPAGNIRLRRTSILWHDRKGPRQGYPLGLGIPLDARL
jgi:phage tail-like protein